MIDTGITISQYDQWQALRHKDITSSDCSALFGLSPYLSYFGLWHKKASATPADFQASEAMEWGNELQEVIARRLARVNGLIIKDRPTYCRHDVLQMGSSFDYEIIGTTEDSPYRADFEKYGNGIFEIKNVDRFAYSKEWKQEQGHDLKPYVEVQVQHQLLISGLKWGLVGALVGGNTGKVVRVIANPDVHKAIEMAVEKFWLTIYAKEEPQPDFKIDADEIISRYQTPTDDEALFLDDPVIDDLVTAYFNARDREKEAVNDKKAIQAQILDYVGNVKKAVGTSWKISRSFIAEKPDSVITEDMVGQVVKGKKAYATFSVNEI